MGIHLVTVLLLLLVVPYILTQGSEDEKPVVKRRLELINKPAIKSFVTQHGDILDCVEIQKQLAFDHPLLKNHSIQMKPNFKIPKRDRLNDNNSSSILTVSQLLPKDMRCPKGTVLIKRVQEEDLTMEKFSSLFGRTFPTSNSSHFAHPTNDAPQIRGEIAALQAPIQNTGAGGMINLWNPEVKPDQYSGASIYVGNDNGSVAFANYIVVSWAVYPFLYKDSSTRLHTYWTKDTGKSTGCVNALCPGFVQISKRITLGQVLSPISKRAGDQYFIDLTIIQDVKTKNWFLSFGQVTVGYWPMEVFGTLVHGAKKAGWGGEIQSPTTESTPGMGGSRLSKENYREACLMKWLQFRAPRGFPDEKELKYAMTNPNCYDLWYGGNYPTTKDEHSEGDWGNFIYFGGPPGCKY